MDTYTNVVASRVNKARRAQGVAIPPLAEATGIPESTLEEMLTGETPFDVSYLLCIAHELGCDAGDWMTSKRDEPAEVAA